MVVTTKNQNFRQIKFHNIFVLGKIFKSTPKLLTKRGLAIARLHVSWTLIRPPGLFLKVEIEFLKKKNIFCEINCAGYLSIPNPSLTSSTSFHCKAKRKLLCLFFSHDVDDYRTEPTVAWSGQWVVSSLTLHNSSGEFQIRSLSSNSRGHEAVLHIYLQSFSRPFFLFDDRCFNVHNWGDEREARGWRNLQ